MLNANIFILLCSLGTFIFGIYILLSKKPPRYFNMILFAIACQLFSRIYYIISILCYDGLPRVFNIGFIGFANFFLCILFSNYGMVDLLVDENQDRIMKYDILAGVVPAAEIIASIIAFTTKDAELSMHVSYAILSLLAAVTGYYNFKHALIPDVESGIAKSLRRFNMFCIIIEVCMLMEVGCSCFGFYSVITPVQYIQGLFLVLLLPILYEGVSEWTH